MDLESLLQNHSDDAPSGDNLDYDPVFIELELIAQPGEEKQIGDAMVRGDDPDYEDVAEKAMDVIARSHDLRGGVYLAEAILFTQGLPGLADATGYLRGCLEQHWASCYPQLDEDDDNDPTMRVNAIRSLADSDTVLHALRRAALTDSKSFGKISLRDILIAEGASPAPEGMENVPDTVTVSAAFQDTEADILTNFLAAAKTALENTEAIDAKFNEMIPGAGPDLDALVKMLKLISRKIAELAGLEIEETESQSADDDGRKTDDLIPGTRAIGGINSSTDVSNVLDRIIEYFERAEPSSPVPVLLKRAKRLVNADFLTIMKDMAPSGVENVNLIGGIDQEEDY